MIDGGRVSPFISMYHFVITHLTNSKALLVSEKSFLKFSYDFGKLLSAGNDLKVAVRK